MTTVLSLGMYTLGKVVMNPILMNSKLLKYRISMRTCDDSAEQEFIQPDVHPLREVLLRPWLHSRKSFSADRD